MAEDKKKQEEMYLAIDRWQESGLSQKAFCLMEKINYPVFGYWLRKYRKQRTFESVCNTARFMDVAIEPDTGQKDNGALQVRYPNGVVICCHSHTSPDRLRLLINLV